MSTNTDTRRNTCPKCNQYMQFTFVSHDPELQKRGQDGLICDECRVEEDRQVVLK